MMAQALVHAKQRDAGVDATLHRLVDGIAQQTEVSGLIQQQLDLNLQAANGVAEGTKTLTEAVNELALSNRQGTELLSRLIEQSRETADARTRGDRSLKGWMIALLCASAGLTISALILGWIALSQRG